jgi:hypothetical protein
VLANLLYKDFLIIAGADIDKVTGKWIPIASISLAKDHGRRRAHFLTDLPKRFTNSSRAVDFGVTAGKHWVNRHIKTQPPRESRVASDPTAGEKPNSNSLLSSINQVLRTQGNFSDI